MNASKCRIHVISTACFLSMRALWKTQSKLWPFPRSGVGGDFSQAAQESSTTMTLLYRTVRYENSDERKRSGDWTLVQDGTACGEKLICVNQTCESLYPYIEPGHCETNNNALECSGHGVSIWLIADGK